jgi:hypothetical protein
MVSVLEERRMLEEETAESIEQVAEILRQLKQAVRERRLQAGADSASSGASTWLAALDRVYASANVNPHLPIAWPTWPRGFGPKIVALTQKVVRRLLRWYINPIVEQQNRFNLAVAQALDVLWREFSQMQAHPLQEERGDSSMAE